MSDPAGAMQAAIEAALRADAALQAMFPAGKVRLYDVPPTNAPSPYITIGDDSVTPIYGESLDLAELLCTAEVWSLTSPPGKAAAKKIGARVAAVLVNVRSPDGLSLRAAHHERSSYLIDLGDNQTAHGVIVVRYACEHLAS